MGKNVVLMIYYDREICRKKKKNDKNRIRNIINLYFRYDIFKSYSCCNYCNYFDQCYIVIHVYYLLINIATI